jgi:hypothetical protein
MANRSILRIAPPRLMYDTIEDESPKPVTVVPREKVTLFLRRAHGKTSKTLLQTGVR